MKKIKVIIGLFVLFGIMTVLLFNTAIPVKSQSDEQNPHMVIAEGYAKHHGVSVDEALLRLELQNSFPELEPQLESNESATFGGLWIQHEPEYKIVVAFTLNGENTITKYSDYIPNKISPLIEVRSVNKSLAELLDDQEKLLSSLNKQDIQADSRVDVINNCVSINVSRHDEAKFKSAKENGQLAIPESLKFNFVENLTRLTTNIYGGLALDDYYGDPYNTAGFSVVKSDGTKGIVSCGHGMHSLYYDSTSLPMQGNALFSGSFDCAWYTCPGLTVQNKIKISDYGTTLTITDIKSRSSQAIGSVIAKYGMTTGHTYGKLTSKTASPSSIPYVSPTWMEVYNEYGFDVMADDGDSGCPWYTEGKACGIQSSIFVDDDDIVIYAYYMAVDYLGYMDISIMTSP